MFNPSLWRMRKFADSVPEMMHLQREINRLFSNVGQTATLDYPSVNIWEKDDCIIVMTELPGFDPEKIDISVTGTTLTLSGTSEAMPLKEGEVYLRQERETGNFQRTFQLPFEVEAEKIEAKYEKGVLQITLPRLKEDLPKKIKISS